MTQDINALIEGLEYFAKEGDASSRGFSINSKRDNCVNLKLS